MDSSEALAEYAEQKLTSCAATYLRRGGLIQVTFAIEGGSQIVHLHLSGSVDVSLRGEARDNESMYAAVDRIQDKLDETLRRRKEKETNHHGEGDQWDELERVERLAHKKMEEPPATATPEEVVDAAYVINYERARAAGNT